ncbi:MAG: hypothetical protein U5J83_05985 [Bryobacterales bacterium]|nr:hypothetical protein [Bryobacterales bacterium]
MPRYSEFLPTPYAFSFPSEEALQTVRVRIDAEDFLRLELPLAASHRATALLQTGRVTADFLVGDDGRPRAVRLVNLSD